MSAPSARAVALDVISRVIEEGAYSNRVLPAALDRSGLDSRDRAFAMSLAYGTLRRRLPLDAAIAVAARRPVERITPVARQALRLGAYQLLDADVAPHAAVSATVDLVPGKERGFVNAVLRRLATEPPAPPVGEDAEAVSMRTGLQPWAVDELRALVGDEADDAASALAQQARLTIRAVGGAPAALVLHGELVAAGVDASLGEVDPACLTIDGGDPRLLPGFDAGRFAVQDQASVFVTRALDAHSGDRVYDACAAPGGKTLHLAELVGPDGRVLGADRSASRVGLISASARRLRARAWLVVQDASAPSVRDDGFDRVLVDAPCSGIGSARRRPELLWRVPKRRLPELAARQLAIAIAAADALRPGGRMVYAVCTFTRSETDAVCDAFLRASRDVRPVATEGPDGAQERHRLWPHRHGCDGMFVAAFERVSSVPGR